MPNNYTFTLSQDWFTHNIPMWEPHITSALSSLPPGHGPRALEVGTWEGRSAVYLLSKISTFPNSLLVCIDHFDLLRTNAGRERHAKVLHNLSLAGSPFRLLEEFSVVGLMTLLQEETMSSEQASTGFDFVYIDGSHEADDTLLDAELAWRLARRGALLILDDYEWNREPATSIHHPKRGIDAFLALHQGQFTLLHKGYQIIIRKTVDMRIGFLTKCFQNELLDYPPHASNPVINIALCADSAYAMPVAVAIRSAIERTPGKRITFYLIDCGLKEQDKRKIVKSIPPSCEETVTLLFRSLSEGSRGNIEPTWAKIDMLLVSSVLPVERVLFLDADVLIRRDLTDLWSTDLEDKLLGAARDIGHPFGHAGLPKDEQARTYFNAGVLLLNLAGIREQLPALAKMTQERKETRYKDQDALNAFFGVEERGWHEFGIEWNAAGLGTYAARPSPDRDSVWVKGQLKALHADPAIVHFTGPVHPSMSSVLNEYCQPWTSKPWGYAGAPGNPFAKEWREMVEETAWKGIWEDKEYLAHLAAARKEAKKWGIQEFGSRVEEAAYFPSEDPPSHLALC